MPVGTEINLPNLTKELSQHVELYTCYYQYYSRGGMKLTFPDNSMFTIFCYFLSFLVTIPSCTTQLAQMDPLDPAWAHCDSIKGLRSTMTCRYCHKKVGGGGITDFKYHLAGLQGHGSVCESVPEKVKNQMVRLIKNGPAVSRKKIIKRKKRGYVTLAFLKAHVKSKKMKEEKG